MLAWGRVLEDLLPFSSIVDVKFSLIFHFLPVLRSSKNDWPPCFPLATCLYVTTKRLRGHLIRLGFDNFGSNCSHCNQACEFSLCVYLKSQSCISVNHSISRTDASSLK